MHEFAQLQLDVSDQCKEKIKAANRAVIEAVAALRDVELASAHTIFGMTAEAFAAVRELQSRAVMQLSDTSVPMWKNRFELRALPAPSGAAVLPDRALLRSSVADSYVDVDDALWTRLSTHCKTKMQAANSMVVDAIVAFTAIDDPAAHLLFEMAPASFSLARRLLSVDWRALRDMDRPIWQIRFELKSIQDAGVTTVARPDRDHVVTSLLKTFRDFEIPR
ncbi:hypothetical protein [Paraburkholderia sp. SIMBA_054]|uniref:hypothetical protein n=1 Tax=Paraburkholderia sp. SIMBA_054 TaxID=3085795 RepID=UPI00397C01A0